MKFVATILIALVSVASAKVNIQPYVAKANFDSSLVNYLLQPSASAAAANDPALSAQCFNYYLPILTEVANTFSVQYQACLTLASEQTTNLTNQALQDRATYVQEANDICTAYQGCNNLTDTLGFFDCYATVSNQEVSQVYTISNQAISAATTLSQGLKQIEEDEDACTNATQRTYVQNTAQTYEQLDTCLQNGLPDTITTTTEAPTEAPVTTTTASSDDNNNNNPENAAFVVPPVALKQSGDGQKQAPIIAPAKQQLRRRAHKKQQRN